MEVGSIMGSVLALSILLSLAHYSDAGSVGINYGRVGNDLPSPQQAVKLITSTTIQKVKLYDADPAVLRALARTDLEVIIGFPNEQIYGVAHKPKLAFKWVKRNVVPYARRTKISAISVGNEVLSSAQGISNLLVPAMVNLHSALVRYGLDGQVKLSTPHALNILSNSYPPSAGAFRPDIIEPVIKPLLKFLHDTGSFVMINAYPYFAYKANPQVLSLQYALLEPNAGVKDPKTGLQYTNLLDAQMDAVYSAMDALGFHDLQISITETGWPSKGDPTEVGISLKNAATYNANLVRYVNSEKGTPLRPNARPDVYIFALFNENLKPGPASERNYGLFYPDRSKVYDLGLDRSGNGNGRKNQKQNPNVTLAQGTWCVAKGGINPAVLQTALDFACGPGKADCSAIQPGQACFMPNTLTAHASYAFNSYYQKNGKQPWNCDFSGSATVIQSNPSYNGCPYS